VTDEGQWYSALEAEGKLNAQASAAMDEKGKFRESLVRSLERRLPHGHADMIQLIGRRAVNQMVSVAHWFRS